MSLFDRLIPAVALGCLIAFFSAIPTGLCFADWVAGRDLKANEVPDGSQELLDPNPTVSEWSYGWRYEAAGTAMTLYPTNQHTNDNGNPNMQGWTRWPSPDGGDIAVNVGTSDVVLNWGSGPLDPVAPGEMRLNPAADNSFPVVRWTAPANGDYQVSAYWREIDPYGGDGAEGDVTVNGAVVFQQLWNNHGSAAMPPQTLTLLAGDTVDFLLGPRGDYGADSTAFDATITPVPEPASFTLLVAALLGFAGISIARTKS
jgi:hypothetical protein